ncbi:hypothetical protein [Roseovarius sp.]|uniref:hypothetical protein n=1 Tax=Roseovarius sp. TaxID=1486281 RepID=UPI000C629E4C|nr:hypothetical protein [Roseovarius sp.]MAZ19882.1 hypothetical protein [Roseovarius sp.]
MRLQSTELISRYTQSTARLITVLSGGLLFVERFGLNSEAWSFLGRDIAPEQFREAATAVLVFLCVSHLVHWLADYWFYTRWFKDSKVAVDDMGAIGSVEGQYKSMAASTATSLKRLTREIESLRKTSEIPEYLELTNEQAVKRHAERVDTLEKRLDAIGKAQASVQRSIAATEERLNNIAPGFRSVSWLSRFVIYVWYLALPIGLAVLAMKMLW